MKVLVLQVDECVEQLLGAGRERGGGFGDGVVLGGHMDSSVHGDG